MDVATENGASNFGESERQIQILSMRLKVMVESRRNQCDLLSLYISAHIAIRRLR